MSIMKMMVRNVVRNAKRSALISATNTVFFYLLKKKIGEAANAGYHPQLDCIGKIKRIGPLAVGFVDDDENAAKSNLSAYAHENGHKRRFQRNRIKTCILRSFATGIFIDETLAWKEGARLLKQKDKSLDYKVVCLALCTYATSAIVEVHDVYKMGKWVAGKLSKKGAV